MAEKKMIIDDIECTFTNERNVLEVARKNGIDIPSLCYCENLSIYGGCRLCLVENEKGVLDAACSMKRNVLGSRRISLDLDETLIALAVSTTGNPAAKLAAAQLCKLSGCEMHITHMPTPGDEAGLRKIGINLTCDAKFASRDLFVD